MLMALLFSITQLDPSTQIAVLFKPVILQLSAATKNSVRNWTSHPFGLVSPVKAVCVVPSIVTSSLALMLGTQPKTIAMPG